jgi:hypothetical protein
LNPSNAANALEKFPIAKCFTKRSNIFFFLLPSGTVVPGEFAFDEAAYEGEPFADEVLYSGFRAAARGMESIRPSAPWKMGVATGSPLSLTLRNG